ncbi:MAG: Ig-like domain-containing protein, partial [Lachnospiraceae bacterium]|nr:Ig-like domain-containing protein [Lachnospiraceae bacterium]
MKKQRTSVVKRTIAVGLSALMLFVPLHTGMGAEYGAKAEGEGGGGGTPDPIVETYQATEILNKALKDYNFGTAETPDIYKVVQGYDAEAEVPVRNLHVADGKLQIQLETNYSVECSSLDGEKNASSFPMQISGVKKSNPTESISFEANVTPVYKITYEIDVKCMPFAADSKLFMTDIDATYTNNYLLKMASDPATDYPIGVYVKPVVTDVELVRYDFEYDITQYIAQTTEPYYNPDWDVHPDWYSNEIALYNELRGYYEDYQTQAAAGFDFMAFKLSIMDVEYAYSLQYLYKYFVDPISWTDPWDYSGANHFDVKNADNSIIKTIYNKANLKAVSDNKYDGTHISGNDIYVGKLQYAIVTMDQAVTGDLTLNGDEVWSQDLPTTEKSGHNYGCVGYFKSDGTFISLLDKTAPVEIDGDAPKVTCKGLYRKKSDGTWEHLTTGANYMLNENKAYCYVLAVSDATAVDKVKGSFPRKENIDFTKISDAEKANFGFGLYDSIEGTLYYTEINYNDLNEAPSGSDIAPSTTMKIDVKDILGNSEGGIVIAPTVQRFANILDVKCFLNGQEMDENEYRYEDTPVTIHVIVSSGEEIEEISLKRMKNGSEDIYCTVEKGETIPDPFSYVVDETHFANKVDPVSESYDLFSYSVEWDFVIPPSQDVNACLEQLKIVVKTASQDNEVNVGSIIYDKTPPYLELIDTGDTTMWHNSYELKGTIYSGAQTEETCFEEAKYTIAPSGDETGEGTTTNTLANASSNLLSADININVPESKTPFGTKIKFYAKDKSGNEIIGTNLVQYIKVDATAPQINTDKVYLNTDKDSYQFNKDSGYISGNNIAHGNTVSVSAAVEDNLTLDNLVYTVAYPDGNETKTYHKNISGEAVDISQTVSMDIPVLDGKSSLSDGAYSVKIQAFDKAQNPSAQWTVRFELDNTKPILTSKITEGTVGGKAPNGDGTDQYYKSDYVTVQFTIDDENVDTSKLKVTDNNEVQSVTWYGKIGVLSVSGDGGHTIAFEGSDQAGNPGDKQTLYFIMDNDKPDVGIRLNGQDYSESRGRINQMNDVTVNFDVSDANPDYNDYYCRVVHQVPGQSDSVQTYMPTSKSSYAFSEDGDYSVSFYAIDRAGNTSDVRTAQFRIDKNAPQLQILGANGMTTTDTTVTLVMNETMWQDASGEATIYRRPGDGQEELVYKTIAIKPSAAETRITESLVETGTYRIEFSARDQIGHTTNLSQTFTMDKSVPVVSLTGVNNYDKTSESVKFYVEIHEEFFSTKTVTISGTKTDETGKVETLQFPNIKQNANPTIFENVFDQDGIYDITVYVRDAAGNEKSNNVHFIIDKEAPVIGSLDDYDGKIFTEFHWDIDLDELVSDLTVCDVHMYLNGSEYDGVSEIEDGVYTLLITAVDELGHKSEKTVTFSLDTKAPVFIVTGVEDGEVKNESYSIDISLQLDEDVLQSV